MSIEAMKQALEALETCMYPQQKQIQAITSLRQAIEQAEKMEPVKMFAYNCLCGRIMKFESVNGIVAPQREWVGLTDKEMLECNMDGDFMIDRETAKRNVEAKLKDKNYG